MGCVRAVPPYHAWGEEVLVEEVEASRDEHDGHPRGPRLEGQGMGRIMGRVATSRTKRTMCERL